jgi:molecular chaperone DnaK (HSP70)
MPQDAERLRAELGLEPQVHDPDQSVAKGAAVYGQKLAIGRRISVEIAKQLGANPDEVAAQPVPDEVRERAQEIVAAELGMRLPALRQLDDMKVTNVLSHSFGVVALRASGGGDQEFISNLVLAQAPLPASRTRTYGTVEDSQHTVHLRVMENTLRDDAVDDLDQGAEVGDAVLQLTSGLPANSKVEVTFEVDRQGRLQITAKDLAVGGKIIEAVIETSRTMSEQEQAAATTRASGIRVTG